VPSTTEEWHAELRSLAAQAADERADGVKAEEARVALKAACSAILGIGLGERDGLLGTIVDKMVDWGTGYFVDQIGDRWRAWSRRVPGSDRGLESFATFVLPTADVARQFFFPSVWKDDANRKASSDVAAASATVMTPLGPRIDPALAQALRDRSRYFDSTDEAKPLSNLIDERVHAAVDEVQRIADGR
jgi:hypothetical protein